MIPVPLAWPDATLLTTTYLRSTIAALSTVTYPSLTGMKVGRVLADPPVLPFTRVGRAGGPIVDVHDQPRLLVESYAATAEAAAANAGLIRDLMRLMPGVRSGFVVVAVTESAGPAEIYDQQADLNRYMATYSLRIRANTRT